MGAKAMNRNLTHSAIPTCGLPIAPAEELAGAEVTGAVTMWEKAQDHILALMCLEENWDGEGASKVRPELIRSALRLANSLRGSGEPAPHDVYPLPDGNIVLEWQYPDGVIDRIEIEDVGRGRQMTSFPNAQPVFRSWLWPTGEPKSERSLVGETHHVAPTRPDVELGCDAGESGVWHNFPLAA
jgi:hypothetical protein